MCKKVYVNEVGNLSFKKEDGELACLNDLLQSVCEGNSEILGVVELSDGVYSWFSNLDCDESVEDVGEICEYIKIDNHVQDLKVSANIPITMINRILIASFSTIMIRRMFVQFFKTVIVG